MKSPISRHIDARAHAPNSFYHADAAAISAPASVNLVDVAQVDFLVIGMGFTGLAAANFLAQKGANVLAVDAGVIGAGATGRNGGLICPGFRKDFGWFLRQYGSKRAAHLWAIAKDALTSLDDRLARLGLSETVKKGLVYAAHRPDFVADLFDDADLLEGQFGAPAFTRLDKDACAEALGTDVYFGGIIDPLGGRLQPLKLALGMAQEAAKNGAKLATYAKVVKIEKPENGYKYLVGFANGYQIRAQHILLCGDGMLDGVDKAVEAKVMPISSFILATEPLASDHPIMTQYASGMDTRFVVNYWHRTHDNRLIFGGGEKYTPQWPKDERAFVRARLLAIFPSLAKTKIDYVWGGALGLSPTRLPYVNQTKEGLWVAAGYSGQGVALAPFCGEILAKAAWASANGQAFNDDFGALAKLNVPSFPGGRLLRWPMLTAAMSYYALRDKIG